MLQAAAEALGSDVHVAGAIVVPSADDYIENKMRWQNGGALSIYPKFALRADLLRSIATDLGLVSWLHVSDAEAVQGLFYLQVFPSLLRGVAADLHFAPATTKSCLRHWLRSLGAFNTGAARNGWSCRCSTDRC